MVKNIKCEHISLFGICGPFQCLIAPSMRNSTSIKTSYDFSYVKYIFDNKRDEQGYKYVIIIFYFPFRGIFRCYSLKNVVFYIISSIRYFVWDETTGSSSIPFLYDVGNSK